MEPIHRLAAEQAAPEPPPRRRMPTERESLTHKFCIHGHEGFLTAGLYEDGTVGELFISDVGKAGSTLRGVFSAACAIRVRDAVISTRVQATVVLPAASIPTRGGERCPSRGLRSSTLRAHRRPGGRPRRSAARRALHPRGRRPPARRDRH